MLIGMYIKVPSWPWIKSAPVVFSVNSIEKFFWPGDFDLSHTRMSYKISYLQI